MKVFISWSGDISKQVAEALRDWLPGVIQSVDPWLSSEDIEKGARWNTDIARELGNTRLGIICLTADNLESPWLLFEAGALSKTLEETFVCTYLYEIEPSEVTGPLVQFQATTAERDDTRKLLLTINRALGPESLTDKTLEAAFEVWWPILDDKLRAITPSRIKEDQRSEREILEEVLGLLRKMSRDLHRELSPGYAGRYYFPLNLKIEETADDDLRELIADPRVVTQLDLLSRTGLQRLGDLLAKASEDLEFRENLKVLLQHIRDSDIDEETQKRIVDIFTR